MKDHHDEAEITRAFEARTLDNAAFGHADHVRVAFDLLKRQDFICAAVRYAEGIRALAEKAGAPGKFNLTITLAFMSLIAERMSLEPEAGYDAFVRANPDLMQRSVLRTWYGEDRLTSDLARRIFLLPDAA